MKNKDYRVFTQGARSDQLARQDNLDLELETIKNENYFKTAIVTEFIGNPDVFLDQKIEVDQKSINNSLRQKIKEQLGFDPGNTSTIKEELIRLCRISLDQWSDILHHIFPRLYSNYHHLNLAFYRDDKFHMPVHVNEPKYYEPIHSFETKEKYRKLSSLLNSKVELSNSFYSSLYSNMEYANSTARTYTNEIYNYLSLNKNITNSYYNKNYNYDRTT